jgi:hypothetical protein
MTSFQGILSLATVGWTNRAKSEYFMIELLGDDKLLSGQITRTRRVLPNRWRKLAGRFGGLPAAAVDKILGGNGGTLLSHISILPRRSEQPRPAIPRAADGRAVRTAGTVRLAMVCWPSRLWP